MALCTRHSLLGHGRPAGGGGKEALPPLEFEKVASYAAVLQNTLNFSLAPSALAIDTLYSSLKRRKKAQIFRLRPRRAEKLSIFCMARRKRVNFFKELVVLPAHIQDPFAWLST